MSSTDPLKEYASTYPVQDRGSRAEMTRLDIQDAMLNAGMGGVLPEQDDPTTLRRVLDVGCGTGGWLIETAKRYPMIEKLVGGDISAQMMTYAQTKAKELSLSNRVHFHTMDALRILEFPPASFDLVNLRFGVSWIRTWEWTKLLTELLRVTQPGGTIRLTECSVLCENSSPALSTLWNIMLETSFRSGRLFVERSDGITSQLVPLLTQHGLQNIQSRTHTLTYRTGTPEGAYFYEDMRHVFRLILPYFQKWTQVPDDYHQIYQQALIDMQDPDFHATWTLVTAWGRKPDGKSPL